MKNIIPTPNVVSLFLFHNIPYYMLYEFYFYEPRSTIFIAQSTYEAMIYSN